MKRIADILISGCALIVMTPVIIFVAAVVLLSMGRPIFFCQTRIGFHERPFRIIKFRTMKKALTVDGKRLPDADRLTRVGRFLRSTSLDELPELWNVLIGDMSLVGPRPLLPEYVPLYTQVQRRRHAVRPGITGWAQVNGRNNTSWEERFDRDVWYVDNHTMLLDLKILCRTVGIVLSRKGISHDQEATMPRFKGSDQ